MHIRLLAMIFMLFGQDFVLFWQKNKKSGFQLIRNRNGALWMVAGSLLLLTGCATMNASECQNADWELIGFEDGSRGRLSSYVGRHRQACSEYSITPDMKAYIKGHSSGVEQFCTEPNGFVMGRKGVAYNGVCPSELSEDFLNGYRIGEKFYVVLHAINRLKLSVKSDEDSMERLRDQVQRSEDQLVREGVTKNRRRELLDRIRRDQRKIRRLKRQIRRTERDRVHKEYEYEQLKMQYHGY